MAHRSQCSNLADNPLDSNYLPPHYREEYRLAIDALVEDDLEGYHAFLQTEGVVDFLSRPEVEHIKSRVQEPREISQPDVLYTDGEADGSSDTYWPIHSDMEAPALDLGWPTRHSFVGPTEVTTLVNPADPEMPSIKEQARRLIKNAQQVIAVVMDMFTDVDIFADLVDAAARHVAVYILLDEQNSHHFTTMVTGCRVNLGALPMMRVRTVSGTTYFCRTGKSFKGQLMARFLLVDCQAVLSGSYSFMWSFEKIHRCIAHLFLGDLVTTFDEEFRILFAQSKPLVMENALAPFPGDVGKYGSQFAFKRTQSLRNPRGVPYLHLETAHHGELSGYPYGERMDVDRSFRLEDPFRHATKDLGQMQMSSNKFSRMERSFLDQGRPMMASRQMEMNAFKRHSYAEGTYESYSSSRQFMKHRVMNNLEEKETHFQRDQFHAQGGIYDKIRNQGQHHSDQHLESAYLPELEPPESYNRLGGYMLPETCKGTMHESENLTGPSGGRYTQTKPMRPSMGQSYACQTSPTQPHPPDFKLLSTGDSMDRQPQDHSAKQGLRNWRISSYLSTYENPDEEGLLQPLGPDALDEPLEGKLQEQEPRFRTREFPSITSGRTDMLPRYGKPMLPGVAGSPHTEDPAQPVTEYRATSDLPYTTGAESKPEEVQNRDLREIGLTKHDSFRTRLNPMLHRNSRLRSSLIFSSSKFEQHSSLVAKTVSSHEEEDETNPSKTTSIVAQILEKRRSMSREPFDWSSHKKLDAKDSAPTETPQTQESSQVPSSEGEIKKPLPEEKTEATPPVEPPNTLSTATSLNDPESRLQYFKELAAKRKASRMAMESAVRSPEPALKKPDLSDTPPDLAPQKSAIVDTLTKPTASTPETAEMEPEASVITSSEVNFKEDELQSAGQRELSDAPEVPNKEALPSKPTKLSPSPKFFKKDSLNPFKSHSRRVSCDEKVFTDATDAEKSEMKKATATPSGESAGKLTRRLGSTSSLNSDGEGKQDTKAMDFLKKQKQRLKGLLGTKSDKKAVGAAEEKTGQVIYTVKEVSENPVQNVYPASDSIARTSQGDSSITATGSKGEKVNKAASKTTRPGYQSSTSNMLYSSNLRDDTKVILEQISANSQKNRMELAKQPPDSVEKVKEGEGNVQKKTEPDPSVSYQSRNRFQRTQANSHERDSILKRIESLRKEKKVYSRFEMGNTLG
ncbi:protein FAM83H [Brienomyrus brachyistius]|uniref:protein FAM83H n=1 Tax=Brienomyrus brachyistius TaxID=42636 RepID=UPI0020B35626|nr:protein FAM83H [Brienomyrus brachyistius]